MKLKEILHEAIDFDTYLARETEKHMTGPDVSEEEVEPFEVEFILIDSRTGKEVSDQLKLRSSEAPSYPEMVKVEIDGVVSWNDNPNAKSEEEVETVLSYDDAKATISSSSLKELDAWLETRADYSEITDYEYEIDFEDQTGTVSATAVAIEK